MTNDQENRRTFTARVAALCAAPLAFVEFRKARSAAPDCPMAIAFHFDSRMSNLIWFTHDVIDLRTGKPMLDPDGNPGNIMHADEATGMCWAYRIFRNETTGREYRRYEILATGEPATAENIQRYTEQQPEKVPYSGIGLARLDWKTPLRFVPKPGKEAMAAKVRAHYAERERLRDERWPHNADSVSRAYRIPKELLQS